MSDIIHLTSLFFVLFSLGFLHGQDVPVGFASLEGEGDKFVAGGTTGGEGGEIVKAGSQAELEAFASSDQPLIIQIEGTLKIFPKGKEIHIASDKTIIGIGEDATIDEGGFFIGAGVHNIVIRNLNIQNTFVEGDWDGKENDYDGVQMDEAHHVWIDHCRFSKLGDGMIDSRKDTDYITISWNIFTDHNKTFGIGWTENVISKLTIHHNWFRRLNQRNPSCDNAYCHMYNNYLEDIDSYGNYSRGKASMNIENSVFKNVKDPWYHDDEAKLTESGNITEGTSGKQFSNNQGFNPSDYYSYGLDPADQVVAILAEKTGPQEWVQTPPTSIKKLFPETVGSKAKIAFFNLKGTKIAETTQRINVSDPEIDYPSKAQGLILIKIEYETSSKKHSREFLKFIP